MTERIILSTLLLIVGILFKLFPPRNRNRFYGYRTGNPLKNQRTWDEANRYSATLLILLGLLPVCTGFLTSLFMQNELKSSLNIIGSSIVVSFILVIVLTECRLRKFSGEEGIDDLDPGYPMNKV